MKITHVKLKGGTTTGNPIPGIILSSLILQTKHFKGKKHTIKGHYVALEKTLFIISREMVNEVKGSQKWPQQSHSHQPSHKQREAAKGEFKYEQH